MKAFISKTLIVLFVTVVLGPVATADTHAGCHFAFGHGVVEQNLLSPDEPNPYLGPIRLRIGRVALDGEVDMVITDGFNVFGSNPDTGVTRITGFGKTTFDFGELGTFHTWEVDTSTLIGSYPWETSILQGDIRTGPSRFADPYGPPMPWGTGFFANTDATLKGWGSNRFRILNADGALVNEFTYIIWGKICDVDLRGIRHALRH